MNSTLHIKQYSRAQVAGIWALASVPMGLLAWVAAPALASNWNTDGNGLLRALLIFLTVGLIWQGVLAVGLVRMEQGNMALSTLREAMWLRRPPTNKAWWALLPAAIILAASTAIPFVGLVEERDFATVLQTDAGQAFFKGSWGWFLVVVVLVVFNTVLGEELLLRGVMLPRMEEGFGRYAWAWNALLGGVYHLHTPWAIPAAIAANAVFAYMTQRYRSSWFGILLHSVQSVVIVVIVLSVVVG